MWSKKNLKESLAIIAKGNKLDYGSANNLLQSVLRSLNLEDSSDDDEIAPAQSQAADDFDWLPSQLPVPPSGSSTKDGIPKLERKIPTQIRILLRIRARKRKFADSMQEVTAQGMENVGSNTQASARSSDSLVKSLLVLKDARAVVKHSIQMPAAAWYKIFIHSFLHSHSGFTKLDNYTN